MAGTFLVTSILVGNARILVRNLDLPKAQLKGQRVYDCPPRRGTGLNRVGWEVP